MDHSNRDNPKKLRMPLLRFFDPRLLLATTVIVAFTIYWFWGIIGALIASIVWLAAFYGLAILIRYFMIAVPPGTILLVNNPTGVRSYNGPAQVLTFFDTPLALLPLYELTHIFEIKEVNTQRQKVESIEITIRYRITDPLSVYTKLPNRDRIVEERIKEMGGNTRSMVMASSFWHQIVNRQISIIIDDITRNVVFDNPFAQNPLEVSAKRNDLEASIEDIAKESEERLGIVIIFIEFSNVSFSPEIARSINKASIRMEETEIKRIEAEREAMHIKIIERAKSEAKAQSIDILIRSLQERGWDISKDEVMKIARSSIEEVADLEKRLTIHRRSLARLLERQALKGIANTDTDILNDVHDERRNIRNIKQTLRALDIQVIDSPDDEPID